MQIKINSEQTRGRGNYGWLRANYSFSFAHFMDPNRLGFKSLRVINEDFVAPGKGFPTHGHENMEILTIVLRGTLSHTDSLGNILSLTPGKIQRMYAGRGVQHSEFNQSNSEELNLLQIWIEPNQFNLPPEYQEKNFDLTKPFNLLASPSGREHSILIYQEVEVFLINLPAHSYTTLPGEDRDLYLHMIKGEVFLEENTLTYGMSAEIKQAQDLTLKAQQDTLILGFKFLNES